MTHKRSLEAIQRDQQAEAAQPIDSPTVSEPRTRCICGATVLPENAVNHLERRSNGPHKIVEWPTPMTRAGCNLYESLEVMGPSHQELAAAILAIEAEAAQPIDAPPAALRVEYETGRRHGYAEGFRAAQLDVERVVRQTLAIVDRTTPLAVGEPLVQRVLARLATQGGPTDD